MSNVQRENAVALQAKRGIVCMVDLIAVMYHPLIKHCRSFDLPLYLMVYDQLSKINRLIHIIVDLFCICHAKQYITVLISSVSVQAQIYRIGEF